MDERKRVGLVFSYNENWIAGAYYILNIIHALNTLEDKVKPHLVILSDALKTYQIVKNETEYPYIEFVKIPFEVAPYSFFEKVMNKLFWTFLKKNYIIKKPQYPKLDFLYPYAIKGLSDNLLNVNWIPDFQEDHLPHFFSQEEVERRKKWQLDLAENNDVIVLSSNDAYNDFKRLYPIAIAKPFVMPFAVTHPDFSQENIAELRAKYQLPKQYFFAPNQFWAHKNHIVILKAVKLLKDKGVRITVAMSGKENDSRNKDNFSNLTSYIASNNLSEDIKLLGFLPRKEQLCLMKNSLAIIQPSLFEGWSTVVEDAKALNKYLILSNLNVHKEQISENVSFFNPNNAEELALKIEEYLNAKPLEINNNYTRNIKKFGEQFVELINIKG